MTDLVERLRYRREFINRGHGDVQDVPDETCQEAADTIESLQARVRELERALVELEEEQPEKWSFDTIMLAADWLLETRYPPDIFTGVSGDPGPRLVVALRDCRAALKVKP